MCVLAGADAPGPHPVGCFHPLRGVGFPAIAAKDVPTAYTGPATSLCKYHRIFS